MKKILILLDCLDKGGIQTLIFDLLNQPRPENFEYILLLTGNGNFETDLKNMPVKTFTYKRTKELDFNLIKYIREIIFNSRVDIIHSHESITSLHAYFAHIRTKAKLVYTLHGYPGSFIEKLLVKFLSGVSTKVIGVSQEILNNLFPLHSNNKYCVLNNGIDSKRLTASSGELKAELQLNSNVLLFGMIGNFINDVRDQFTICKILPHLFNKHSNIYFIFVGAKSSKYPIYFDKCFNFCKENKILDRVFFLGKRDDISNIFHSLDMYVYSSNHDTFGISVVEAMLCDVPVIVNDIPVFREITQNGEIATLFESKNILDLEQKIEDFDY